MPDQINAIVVDQSDPKRLAVRRFSPPSAAPEEVLVEVKAISLNRGEVKRALTVTPSGTCPGWDFCGIVIDRREVLNAPPIGSRVVGLVGGGAWAARVNAPLQSIAMVPDGVSDAQAASLPVAGLTALHALRKGGLLLGKKVLVDGATGGVGQFAVQLAAAAGAHVFAHVRRANQADQIDVSTGATVIIGESLEAARPFGPFDLVVDGVGGATLSAAMTMLARHGSCVTFGATDGAPVTFDNGAFFRASGTSLRSLILNDELASTEPASEGLALLLDLIVKGDLHPRIHVEADWSDIDDIARGLIERHFQGKAVLHVTG